MLEPADIPRCIPRGELRDADAGQLDQAYHPVAVRGVRREQLEHPVVVERTVDQRPTDEPWDVQIADGDSVGVTERALCHLGRTPRADAGEGAEPAQRI